MSNLRGVATGRWTAPTPTTESGIRPQRAVAGGLVWTAEEDDQPAGARIGFACAVELGQTGPVARGAP